MMQETQIEECAVKAVKRSVSSGNVHRPDGWKFRNWIQAGILLITVMTGIQFFMYVHQASGDGVINIPRPAGVEGFLPIGALLGWKFFLLTGEWDSVHPAAMVILGFAFLISFLLRKSFCGWFCPVGTVSEILWKSGEKLAGKNYRIPKVADYFLRCIKYILLAFFVWVIFSMTGRQLEEFLESPYYKMADVKMLYFFIHMTLTTLIVLFILVVFSLFIRNFWCRYLCPYGALMGLAALISPTRIVRNTDTCTECKKCAKVCPYHLPVDRKRVVRSAECNSCMDCVLACPSKGTLQYQTRFIRKNFWSPRKLALCIVGIYLMLVFTAQITDHWRGGLSQDEFRERLKEIHLPEYRHPQ